MTTQRQSIRRAAFQSFRFVRPALPTLSGLGLALALLAGAAPALAAKGDCGIPFSNGDSPKTSDCLYILRAGVGLNPCAACVCDTSGNQAITAGDALLCLRKAVGQVVPFNCPDCQPTTTTTTAPPDTTTTTAPVDTTTTTLPVVTTTTTIVVDTTTTTAEVTTTTIGNPGGSCPVSAEWSARLFDGGPCDEDTDCDQGVCEKGRCVVTPEGDWGWTGLAHDAGLAVDGAVRVRLDCPGAGGDCGTCDVVGLDPSNGFCRCNNDARRRCDEPFALDSDSCPACLAGAFAGSACADNADCTSGTCARRCINDPTILCTRNNECPGGSCAPVKECENGKDCNVEADCVGTCTTGSLCQCYDGPPQPLLAGDVPLCLVSRHRSDATGTVDVDTGASSVGKSVIAILYSGVSKTSPCPVCGGHCSNDPAKTCAFDAECPGGQCNTDPTPRDGVPGGTCIGGASSGKSCDVDAVDLYFPSASGGRHGAGTSMDCLPSAGSGVAGLGLNVDFTETTGSTSIPGVLPCSASLPGVECSCLVCSGNPAVACRADADCVEAGGTCSSIGTGVEPQPNTCEDFECLVGANGEGRCNAGPDDKFCDAVLQDGGRGIFRCNANSDCTVGTLGIDAGTCTASARRRCFAAGVNGQGDPDPSRPVRVAAFCAGATTNATRNQALGLPGPVLLRSQARLRSYCDAAGGGTYSPGVGGCF